MLDNLGSHNGAAVRDIVRAAGARLFFLPPYSPDLNPIEQLFAKLKHVMRRAARRSVEAIHNAIAATLNAVTPLECRNASTAPINSTQLVIFCGEALGRQAT